jgi:CelD/BcsL family acetyltransferase involved in cellulose biosynthesis
VTATPGTPATAEASGASSLAGRVVRGRDEVLAIGAAWDDLMRRAVGAPAFMDRSWIEPWLRHGRLQGEPCAVTVWEGERLVALLPLAIRSSMGVRIAVPIGVEQPGYHGLVADSAVAGAIEAAADTCLRESVFHVLRLDDAATLDAPTQALLDAFTRRGLRVARDHRNPCPAIDLGCTYDEFLQRTKSSKSRQTLRRKERKLMEGGAVALTHLAGSAITSEAMRRAAVVQDESWMRRRGASVLKEDFYQSLTLSAAGAGIAHLWLVTVDGEDAAFVYALVHGPRLEFVWTAFRLKYEPRSVGQVLLGWSIRDACAMGLETYDFGHGDAEYKRFWSTGHHDVFRVVVARGLPGRLVAAGHALSWRLARVGWLRRLYRALRDRGSERAPPAGSAASEPKADEGE